MQISILYKCEKHNDWLVDLDGLGGHWVVANSYIVFQELERNFPK